LLGRWVLVCFLVLRLVALPFLVVAWCWLLHWCLGMYRDRGFCGRSLMLPAA
jgi:hypothetical protein